MYIQTEFTPNPNAIKFIPGQEISVEQNYFFSNKDAAENSPLAQVLFAIDGVESVFFGVDFITVTKAEKIEWDILKPEVIMVVMEHLSAGHHIVIETSKASPTENDDITTSIEKQIIELIDTRVRPSVAMDGGDIIYKGFKDGIVLLELHGACSGCPSSSITLKEGIESMLQYYVPEVQAVEAIDSE